MMKKLFKRRRHELMIQEEDNIRVNPSAAL